MILTAIATLLLAAAAMTPGLILCRAERLRTDQLAAVGTASLVVSMMATALLAAMSHWTMGKSLPAMTLLPVSLLLALAAYLGTRQDRCRKPEFEWQGIVVAVLFVIHGVIAYALAVSELPDGSLRIHAWYNADWFKHIGHTFAIADYGLPARDIFGGGRPLHYYWLSYILPAAATESGGDAWTALYVFNIVCAGLLALSFYGAVRISCANRNVAAVITTLATVICAPFIHWGVLLSPGGYDLLMHGLVAPSGPAFTGFSLYIPQHALALALLLGWAILALGQETTTNRSHWVAIAGLTTVMTISTLFGATLLGVYGLVELCRRRLNAVRELIVIAILSCLLVMILGVFMLGDPGSPLQSPLLQNPRQNEGPLLRGITSVAVVIGSLGLTLPASVIGAYYWHPNNRDERNAKMFALILVLVAVLAAFVAGVGASERVAHEIRIRVLNLPAISTGIIGGWALMRAAALGRRHLSLMITGIAVLTLLALPSLVLRTAWHGIAEDRFTTIIPASDRKVLAALRAASTSREVVWQFPEKPFLSDLKGGDSWSVVLAGRTNVATERATNYPAADPYIKLAYSYFAGKNVPVPRSVDWIYLSRTLHPDTYDTLKAKLGRDNEWRKRACYPGACLFSREESNVNAQ